VTEDIGRVINPTLAEGQAEGGLQQGLGFALTEEMIVDQENGVVVNPSFMDYKTFTSLDMPTVEVFFTNTFEPTGPLGAKSGGELSIIPTAAAVANAIYNATGIRIKELPITPSKFLAQLKR